jgi:acetoin utilization protein AcuB
MRGVRRRANLAPDSLPESPSPPHGSNKGVIVGLGPNLLGGGMLQEALKQAKKTVAHSKAVTVRQCMTPAPHSIGKDQPLSVAHELMKAHGLRHLPVLQGGKLVGMLTERDLLSLEAQVALDPDDETVEDGMTQDVYTTTLDANLRDVVADMAKLQHRSAVVVDQSKIVGIFTTTDALELLRELL